MNLLSLPISSSLVSSQTGKHLHVLQFFYLFFGLFLKSRRRDYPYIYRRLNLTYYEIF